MSFLYIGLISFAVGCVLGWLCRIHVASSKQTQLKNDVAELKTGAPDGRATVDVATFKDRYGISRKFAIPLLEYLDRERVTRRTGDVRLVL